jgi:hypothetical protein
MNQQKKKAEENNNELHLKKYKNIQNSIKNGYRKINKKNNQ